MHEVSDPDETERLRIRGSPTVMVDGADPFAEPLLPVGLACRVYPFKNGLAGSPTVEQLMAVAVCARGWRR